MKKICVLGLGYIGLPTAAMLGTHGYQVIGVDVNPHIIEVLRGGDIHIEEPGLRTLVEAALRSGNLRVQGQPEAAEVFIIAVPTPIVHPEGKREASGAIPRSDLAYVTSAAQSVVPHLRRGNLVVLESTSPPGTTDKVLCPILETSGLRVGRDLFVAHSPERVLPGRVLEELVTNDRVIGGIDQPSSQLARAIYASFVQGQIFLTDATTAEMVKLMENTYRDVNIALANEFALVAEHVGINVWEAIELANRHPRVKILKPGPGVGGHCIAVDPWFIAEAAPAVTPLIQTARRVNDEMPSHVMELVRAATSCIPRPVVACLGLTFKADVDDIRESPAIRIVELLEKAGILVRAYDPHVRPGQLATQALSLREVVAGADLVLVLTDHSEFRQLRPEDLEGFTGNLIIDARNTLPATGWAVERPLVRRLGDGQAMKHGGNTPAHALSAGISYARCWSNEGSNRVC